MSWSKYPSSTPAVVRPPLLRISSIQSNDPQGSVAKNHTHSQTSRRSRSTIELVLLYKILAVANPPPKSHASSIPHPPKVTTHQSPRILVGGLKFQVQRV